MGKARTAQINFDQNRGRAQWQFVHVVTSDGYQEMNACETFLVRLFFFYSSHRNELDKNSKKTSF